MLVQDEETLAVHWDAVQTGLEATLPTFKAYAEMADKRMMPAMEAAMKPERLEAVGAAIRAEKQRRIDEEEARKAAETEKFFKSRAGKKLKALEDAKVRALAALGRGLRGVHALCDTWRASAWPVQALSRDAFPSAATPPPMHRPVQRREAAKKMEEHTGGKKKKQGVEEEESFSVKESAAKRREERAKRAENKIKSAASTPATIVGADASELVEHLQL